VKQEYTQQEEQSKATHKCNTATERDGDKMVKAFH
jgi:hypothetical protein